MPALLASCAVTSFNGNSATGGNIDTTGASLLIAAVAYNFATVPSWSDSLGNVWTQLNTYASGSAATITFFWCVPQTVGAGHNFTASAAGSHPTFSVLAFSGATLGYDQQSGIIGSGGTSIQPGTISPATGGEVIVSSVAFGISSGGTSWSVSGMTYVTAAGGLIGVGTGLAIAYAIQAGTAPLNPTWTANRGISAAANIAAFAPAFGALLSLSDQAQSQLNLSNEPAANLVLSDSAQ